MSTEQTDITPTAQAILARILVAREKGATGTDLKRALEPLLGHRWPGAQLTDRIGEVLAELERAGLVTRVRKGKTERATLTPDGQSRSLAILGLNELPPKITWDKIKKTCLAARALAIPQPQGDAAKAFGTDTGFKAALLKKQFKLPLAEVAKLDSAIGALCWQLMGFDNPAKFAVKSVQTALLRRALGEPPSAGPKPDPKKEVAKLLAKQVGARQSGRDEIRLATIRAWLEKDARSSPQAASGASPSIPPLAHEPHPTAPTGPQAALDLEAFARRVLQAARASSSGRFGANKVFVSHVWHAVRSDPAFAGLTFDRFKQRLAEANNARLLNLSRADMVEAMDPDDVRQSEVPYLGATFHFIRI